MTKEEAKQQIDHKAYKFYGFTDKKIKIIETTL